MMSGNISGLNSQPYVPEVIEIAECVEPNICINDYVYDVYSTQQGRLLHSSCPGIAPLGISTGRGMWWKFNWCHQIPGAT